MPKRKRRRKPTHEEAVKTFVDEMKKEGWEFRVMVIDAKRKGGA